MDFQLLFKDKIHSEQFKFMTAFKALPRERRSFVSYLYYLERLIPFISFLRTRPELCRDVSMIFEIGGFVTNSIEAEMIDATCAMLQCANKEILNTVLPLPLAELEYEIAGKYSFNAPKTPTGSLKEVKKDELFTRRCFVFQQHALECAEKTPALNQLMSATVREIKTYDVLTRLRRLTLSCALLESPEVIDWEHIAALCRQIKEPVLEIICACKLEIVKNGKRGTAIANLQQSKSSSDIAKRILDFWSKENEHSYHDKIPAIVPPLPKINDRVDGLGIHPPFHRSDMVDKEHQYFQQVVVVDSDRSGNHADSRLPARVHG